MGAAIERDEAWEYEESRLGDFVELADHYIINAWPDATDRTAAQRYMQWFHQQLEDLRSTLHSDPTP